MDRFDNMGGRDLACDNGDYKRQTKSDLVHDWACKITS
jgi:hypothetical protein